MKPTEFVTRFEARIVHGSDLENDEWTVLADELGTPIEGSDFDDVLERARECEITGVLVIAEVRTRYHVVV